MKSFTFEINITACAEVTVEGVDSLEEAEAKFEEWKASHCYPAHNGWHLESEECDAGVDWNFEQEVREE